MKVTTAMSKLSKLGVITTNTVAQQHNGEDDSIFYKNFVTVQCEVNGNIIEICYTEGNEKVEEFLVYDKSKNRYFPLTLTAAIKLAA